MSQFTLSEAETRELMLVGLEYSTMYEEWVFPLENALEGVTAVQAAWRPGDEEMGIWDIVLHTAVWNENIIERIRTGEKARPQEGAWPARAKNLNEVEWTKAKNRLTKSVSDLSEFLRSVSMETIRSSPYGFGDLICRFIHMGYHIGQITKIRECHLTH